MASPELLQGDAVCRSESHFKKLIDFRPLELDCQFFSSQDLAFQAGVLVFSVEEQKQVWMRLTSMESLCHLGIYSFSIDSTVVQDMSFATTLESVFVDQMPNAGLIGTQEGGGSISKRECLFATWNSRS
ncbi:hypothetical protein CPB97_003004 [Podila verticillata]|nr:hypothetical protein CPB97_003004 [Podila verticillata]